jgi:glycosyltransferase involved in cell wall biosynthesis
MTRVVIITNMMSFYRLDLFNELAKDQGIDLHCIFASEREENQRTWEIKKDQLNFSYSILQSTQVTQKAKGIHEQRIIHIPRGLKSVLKARRPDVIIGAEYNPVVLRAFFYARFHKIPYISWSDGTLDSERAISFIQKQIRKFICKRSAALLASSSLTVQAQEAYGAEPGRIFTSLLTVNVKDFQKRVMEVHTEQNSIPTILFCGYLIKLKGISCMLRALTMVDKPWKLVLVGSGEEEEALRHEVDELGLGGRVEFAGYKKRDEIAACYAQADIFVFPTLKEAFGLVLVEALAAGLPLVCSYHAGAVHDVLEDEKNGFVIDPEATGDFAAAIDKLIGDRELISQMSEKSLEISEKFTLEEVVKGFKSAIKSTGTV